MNQKINSLTTGPKRHIYEPLIPDMMDGNISPKTGICKTKIYVYWKADKSGLDSLLSISVPYRSELGPNDRSDENSDIVLRPITLNILQNKANIESSYSKSLISTKANEDDLRKEANKE